tara:strand:- start:23139 stop:23336 length:198 start_codon:yes stop_codon:yes gene_type:complete
MVNAEKLKSLISRGAAVVKKAMKIRDQSVVYHQAPKKMRKISLDAAFEKEKKSSGKNRKNKKYGK